MNKPWVDIGRQELIDLCRETSYARVAKQFGVTPAAVATRMRLFGIHRGPKRSFVPPLAELKKLYQTMTMAQLAAHYGVGETVIFKRISEYGIEKITKSQRLKGKPKTLEHRLNMSLGALASGVRAGSKNGNWKGGKIGANRSARSKAAYREWKVAALKAANWKCSKCGLEHYSFCDHCGHRVRLHVHHIKPFSEFPELRYEVTNAEVLCDRCHWMEHREQSGEFGERPNGKTPSQSA